MDTTKIVQERLPETQYIRKTHLRNKSTYIIQRVTRTL
jgi:hypothetical protein